MSGVTVSGVTRRYGGHSAVRGVTLAARDNEILAILGASGSGKSTLMRLIAGLEPLDEGDIRLGERLASRAGYTEPPETRRVGLVFQDYALFPHMTALQNVAFGLAKTPAPARQALARQWLETVGLGARGGAFPHELSGGEQQRVALARALAPQPAAVLLDEPFSGLDPALRAELRDLTRRIARETGAAFVFVTHDAEEALYMADQLGVMAQGQLVQCDAPRTVYAKPACLAAAAALGPLNLFEGPVQAGRLRTPFLEAPAPGFADGQRAVAAVRVEALVLTPGQAFLVADRRPQGGQDLVLARCEASGLVWRGLVPAGAPAFPRCAVTAPEDSVFVFPA